MHVAATVDGSDIRIDLTGTSPEIDLPVNMPLVGTVDIAVHVTLRSLLLDTAVHDAVSTNAGLFRPVTITAPEGTWPIPGSPRPRSRASAPATSSPTR